MSNRHSLFQMALISFMLLFFSLGASCSSGKENNSLAYRAESDNILGRVPDGWTRYYVSYGAFGISVPPTMELRKDKQLVTERISNCALVMNKAQVVFQQKGLSTALPQKQNDHYARVMIDYSISEGDTPYLDLWDDWGEITQADKDYYRELVEQNLKNPYGEADFQLVEEPTYRGINLEPNYNLGMRALEIAYRRTGYKNTTANVHIYILFNHWECAQITVAYREQEAELWKSELNKVISTFSWKI